jgi:anti-sigma factor RsiW
MGDTMNHHRAGQLLSAYLDGELPSPDAAAVQEHLMDCSACRDAYADLRATKGLLGALPVAEPPAEFWTTVRAIGARRESAPVRWRLPLPRRPAWVLAAAVIVLVLAALPLIKGTVDRLHATEIGVDLYIREHAREMSMEPLADRAYLGLVTGDADLVVAGETPRGGEGSR